MSFRINQTLKKQNRVADYLNINYIQPYFDGKLPHWDIRPKQNLETQKIVWQLWYQGFDKDLPPVIRACFHSVDKYMSDYKIIRLTKDTIADYLDLPGFTFEKTGKAYKMAHFSDLLRVCLLAAYGGLWLDAKILLTGKIDSTLLEKDFFLFQRTAQPPIDEQQWVEYYHKYFYWNEQFKVNSLNSFIVAKKNYPLLEIMKNILFAFWQNENKVQHYFWFQIMFNEVVKRADCQGLNCEIINDIDVHRIQLALKDEWTPEKWQQLCRLTTIHKLRVVKNFSEKSFYAYILRQTT
ncbi:MAG: capsular polysaccharide synthesis protein [Candidatus Symbiothrix sp.]|nr:capsular polysaccharide synthesis protein [Candidatus Symbiothrix sp.]